MRWTSPKTALLGMALLLLVPPASAQAGRHVPRDALVEEVARGAAVPDYVQEAGPPAAEARTPSQVRRRTTVAERAWIERLAAAHKRDDMAPFREALAATSTWVREVALEGIPHGRLEYGVSWSPTAIGAVRAADLRRVAAFLPELRALALASSPLNPAGGLSRVRELAIHGLRRLAETGHQPAIADKAFSALVEVAQAGAREPAIHGLVAALRARPALRPTAAARSVLVGFVKSELDAKRVGWDAGHLIGRLREPSLTEALHTLVRSNTRNFTWLTFLAEAQHPASTAIILKELESHPIRRGHALEAARLMPSEAYLPALRRELAEDVISYRQTLGALAAIGGPAVARVLKSEVLKLMTRSRGPVDDELLVPATDAWLTVDAAAAGLLRARLASLASMPRLAVLQALAKHGERGLLPSLRPYLGGAAPSSKSHVGSACEVLGYMLAGGQEPGALALLHAQLKRLRTRQWVEAFGVDPYRGPWPALLRAVQAGDVRDAVTEGLLLGCLGALRSEHASARLLVVRALGITGGERSLDVLGPLCQWPATLLHGGPQLRLAARSAVARIEQRLEK